MFAERIFFERSASSQTESYCNLMWFVDTAREYLRADETP
jgi:hypothetical protein